MVLLLFSYCFPFVLLWFPLGFLWFSYDFPMVFVWFPAVFLRFSNEFVEIFLANACSLHGFRKEPIPAPFSQTFGRPWTPFGSFSDALGTPMGSPWAHLGPPWTPQTTPCAHLGRPLGPPWDPHRKALKKLVFGSTFVGPLISLKTLGLSNAK